MRLSLICPTIGRPMMKLLQRVIPQLKSGDEFIVVADGPIPTEADKLLKLTSLAVPQVIYLPLPICIGDYGCTPCDMAIGIAKGDAVFFIGDDDLVTPGAFSAIRAKLARNPDVPHLFSMLHSGRTLGHTLALCNVSGQQIVIPRDMSKMPSMADVSPDQLLVSDWVFITKVHEAWDSKTMFHDFVIAHLEKQNYGKT